WLIGAGCLRHWHSLQPNWIDRCIDQARSSELTHRSGPHRRGASNVPSRPNTPNAFNRMKLTSLLSFCALGFLFPAASSIAAVVVNDVYADGNSQNQDLPNNSVRLFNARTANPRVDAVGSTTFTITTGSEGFWGFFTNSGSPINLAVGDTLNVNVTFSTGNT